MSIEIDIREAYKSATWQHANGPDIFVELVIQKYHLADIGSCLINEGFLVRRQINEELKHVEIWISNKPILRSIVDLHTSSANLLTTSIVHPWELAVAEYLDSLRAAGSVEASDLREPEGRSLTFPLKGLGLI